VDQGIEKVDEAIKKTQRLKNGLMQELLTKGIGHKEFKDTEIGRIPKKWEVTKIMDLGEIITGKTPSTSNTNYWNGSIPFITPVDIKEHKYVYGSERCITQEGAQQIRFILPQETVLVVCIGSTIGKI
jgi:type I restriction enzyme S subunit